jgi:uncharacterized protein (DUF305 family)
VTGQRLFFEGMIKPHNGAIEMAKRRSATASIQARST